MVKKQEKIMRRFGLLGKNISYSFSKSYFENKFKNETITDATYENFDIDDISLFQDIIKNTEQLRGINVTIPYKQSVIPYLNRLNKKAKKIGAVNTIKVTKKGKLIGYNTDCYGFKKTLKPYLKSHHKSALILGTGGASKAIAYTLKTLGIKYLYVSRKASETAISYSDLSNKLIENHRIIINCTPLGTYPNIDACPDIPYDAITNKHILFDLIYNPEETKFLSLGNQNNATIINGRNMLKLQAEKSWSIWNSK